MDRKKEAKSFIKLLSDEASLKQGGEHLERWAEELLSLTLSHRNILGSGGLLVPQLGKESGLPKKFIHCNYPEELSFDISSLERAFTEFWEHRHIETVIYDVESIKNNTKLKLLISPISFGFDRPIGFFWVLVANDHSDVAKSLLEYCSILTSICIRANKACNALNLMSKPVWRNMSSSKEVAKYAADLCRMALSCRAVIVWLKTSDKLLSTIATSGENADSYNYDMSIGKGLAGKCVEHGEFSLHDDLLEVVNDLEHPDIVKALELRSAMFIPLDFGDGEAVGAFGVYASRPRAFSEIDKNIADAVSQVMTYGYAHTKRLEDYAEMETKIQLEAPAIETGLLAIERIHDVRNQLGFAQDQLNFILDIEKDKKNSQIIEYVRAASNHIKNSSKTVKALERRAKLFEFNPKNINLREFLETIMNGYTNEFLEASIKTNMLCPEDIMIYADYDHMERVFSNIIGNAIYFLSPIGRERKLNIRVERNGQMVTVYVRDNGPGISPEVINKVFDIFFTTKGGKGMGYGLHIAKRIVQEHKGVISVHSIWGQFTEFIIKLPNAEV